MSNSVKTKSFRLRVPIKTTKCENIIKELRKKQLTHARNEAHEYSINVRIELRIFVRHFVEFHLQKIMATLYYLFQQLKDEKQKRSQIIPNNKCTIIKTATLNLTGKDIDKNVTSSLNLGLNFFATPKSIPCMTIITTIESQALNLEFSKKDTSAENLRQTVSKILSKTIGKKQQDNLGKTQRKTLKQLKNDKQIKVYPFDKGIGFVLLNDIDNISKIEE